nr:scarecrow-like protein 4 [Ipomoea batatas]
MVSEQRSVVEKLLHSSISLSLYTPLLPAIHSPDPSVDCPYAPTGSAPSSRTLVSRNHRHFAVFSEWLSVQRGLRNDVDAEGTSPENLSSKPLLKSLVDCARLADSQPKNAVKSLIRMRLRFPARRPDGASRVLFLRSSLQSPLKLARKATGDLRSNIQIRSSNCKPSNSRSY